MGGGTTAGAEVNRNFITCGVLKSTLPCCTLGTRVNCTLLSIHEERNDNSQDDSNDRLDLFFGRFLAIKTKSSWQNLEFVDNFLEFFFGKSLSFSQIP